MLNNRDIILAKVVEQNHELGGENATYFQSSSNNNGLDSVSWGVSRNSGATVLSWLTITGFIAIPDIEILVAFLTVDASLALSVVCMKLRQMLE